MKASKLINNNKKMHRNLAYTALFAFSMYICYKTYQTQQRIREGLSVASEAKNQLKKDMDDAIATCIDSCPVNKDACPKRADCDRDDKECKDEASNCNNGTKDCKAACQPPKTNKKK